MRQKEKQLPQLQTGVFTYDDILSGTKIQHIETTLGQDGSTSLHGICLLPTITTPYSFFSFKIKFILISEI